jgi:hypothetical protein
MRRIVTMSAVLALLAGCVAGAAAVKKKTHRRAPPKAIVAVINSHAGEPVLRANGMRPGDSAAGLVELANTGNTPVQVALVPDALTETPGSGGGVLSERLVLSVDDVTDGGDRRLYSGPLRALKTAAVGRLEPRASRRYRLTATFPDGGRPPDGRSGDNAYQGSSLSMSFRWSGGIGAAARVDSTRLIGPLVRRLRVIGKGLAVHVYCRQACRAAVSVSVGHRVLARQRVRLRKAGARNVLVKLRRGKPAKVVVRVRVEAPRLRPWRRSWTVTYR